MFQRIFALAVVATAVLTPIPTPAFAGCEATNHSFVLGPYESRTFDLCTWGSPFVSATASDEADIDGFLTEAWSGTTIASDYDGTSIVWLRGDGGGGYRYTIVNTSGRWTNVRVEENDL